VVVPRVAPISRARTPSLPEVGAAPKLHRWSGTRRQHSLYAGCYVRRWAGSARGPARPLCPFGAGFPFPLRVIVERHAAKGGL
jgi:hypothetical protein